MPIQSEDRLLIDRYLDGQLSGTELQQFLDRLEKDEDFRKKVSVQNLLIEGIRRQTEQNLAGRLEESLKFRHRKVPASLWMIVVFLFIVFGGIVLWSYLGPGPQIPERGLFSFSWLHSKRTIKNDRDSQSDKSIEQKNKTNRENDPDSTRMIAPVADEQSDQPTDEALLSENDFTNDDKRYADSVTLRTAFAPGQEIVIRKDRLISSHLIPVLSPGTTAVKGEKKGKAKSLSQMAQEKLGEDSGLPQDEDVVPVMQVELWQSPVNYRGYKLSVNRLQLFGLEEISGIKLYNIEGQLFLQYFNEYYLLRPSQEYLSYLRVREQELPAALSQ